MHLNKPYQFINNQILHHSIDNDEKTIEKEIKYWYTSVDGGKLDGVITKYTANKTTIRSPQI